MSKEIAQIFIERIKKNDDSLSNLITINTFCESAINKLIMEKAPQVKSHSKEKPTMIIPIDKSTYATKLYFAYALDFIDEDLYENLITLNTWRNKIAHDIRVKIDTLPMRFIKFDKEEKDFYKGMPEDELVRAIAFATYVKLFEVITIDWKINL